MSFENENRLARKEGTSLENHIAGNNVRFQNSLRACICQCVSMRHTCCTAANGNRIDDPSTCPLPKALYKSYYVGHF